ncbi:MAG TPA: hypothetical protein VFF67_03475 [Thermoplasmata archaeon]|nr:hypothetical protein [Thermoplasmata archaeon]
MPVILAAAIVAAGGGAAAYIYWQNQLAAQQSGDNTVCGTNGVACPPPPPILSVGVAIPHGVGPTHWYNASVNAASGGIELQNASFRFLTESGGGVVPAGNWSLTVVNGTGNTVGAYSFTASSWTQGGPSLFDIGQTVSIYSANTALDGDTMLITVTNGPASSVNIA